MPKRPKPKVPVKPPLIPPDIVCTHGEQGSFKNGMCDRCYAALLIWGVKWANFLEGK